MKNRRIIILSIMISIFMGCNKEGENSDITIKGKIIKSCTDSSPVVGLHIFVYNESPRSSLLGSCNQTEKGAITDENGEFSITYNEGDVCNGSNQFVFPVYIGYSNDPRNANSILMTGFPGYYKGGKEYNVTIIKENPTKYYYKIKTTKNYTDKDTIYYLNGAFTYKEKFIIGPFKDGMVFDSFTTYIAPQMTDDAKKNYVELWEKIHFIDHSNNEIFYVDGKITTRDKCEIPNDIVYELP